MGRSGGVGRDRCRLDMGGSLPALLPAMFSRAHIAGQWSMFCVGTTILLQCYVNLVKIVMKCRWQQKKGG